MHCTSPVHDENHSLNRMLPKDYNRNCVDSENNNGFVDNINDDELYDGWPSPMQNLVQNRTWFCCSNERRNDPEQAPIRFHSISRRYSIIRTEPTSQSEIVFYYKLMNSKWIWIT